MTSPVDSVPEGAGGMTTADEDHGWIYYDGHAAAWRWSPYEVSIFDADVARRATAIEKSLYESGEDACSARMKLMLVRQWENTPWLERRRAFEIVGDTAKANLISEFIRDLMMLADTLPEIVPS